MRLNDWPIPTAIRRFSPGPEGLASKPVKADGPILGGETALITGAGRGIGRAIAEAFAREGAAVALVARSARELEDAARAIQRAGGTVCAHPADVTDERSMTAVVESVRAKLGPVSILVNGAGTIEPIGPFGESPPDDWWRCVEVNLRGAALCAHLVVHDMASRGRGRIINIVSGAGILGSLYFSAYSAGKTALVRWSEILAGELAPYGVRVFAMEPGTVATAMSGTSRRSRAGRRWIPWFEEIFRQSLDVPMEAVARRAVDLAAGAADALSGRYLPLRESLDDLVRDAARVRQDTLYSLRIARLPGPPPSEALAAVRSRGESASPSVVHLRRRLPVGPDDAFDLWRDGKSVEAWFLPPGVGEWIGESIMEPRAGGRLHLELSSGGHRYRIRGTVTNASPGKSLSLEWSWESNSPVLGSARGTIVDVETRPAPGGTDMVVTHDGLPGEEVRDAYIRGWRRCLEGMERVVGAGRRA